MSSGEGRLPPRADVVVRAADLRDRPELERMFSGYIRELAALSDTVSPESKFQLDWLRKPGELFPYLISVGSKPVGFALVMGRRYAEAIGESRDFFLHDIFVEYSNRGTGVGAEAATRLIAASHGTWGFHVLVSNEAASVFWDGVLERLRPEELDVERAGDADTYRFRVQAPAPEAK